MSQQETHELSCVQPYTLSYQTTAFGQKQPSLNISKYLVKEVLPGELVWDT